MNGTYKGRVSSTGSSWMVHVTFVFCLRVLKCVIMFMKCVIMFTSNSPCTVNPKSEYLAVFFFYRQDQKGKALVFIFLTDRRMNGTWVHLGRRLADMKYIGEATDFVDLCWNP